jgi:hypothetical protein
MESPPPMTRTSPVAPAMAARVASRSSGRPIVSQTSPPQERISAGTTTPLTSWTAPGGSSASGPAPRTTSSPVMSTETRGLRRTGTWVKPEPDSGARWWGSIRVPACTITAPARRSVPASRIDAPTATGAAKRAVGPSSSTTS